jgi:hypothetical protein
VAAAGPKPLRLLCLQRGAELRIGLKNVAHAQALAEGVGCGAQGERAERWSGGGRECGGWVGGEGGVGGGKRQLRGVGGAVWHLQTRRLRAARQGGGEGERREA